MIQRSITLMNNSTVDMKNIIMCTTAKCIITESSSYQQVSGQFLHMMNGSTYISNLVDVLPAGESRQLMIWNQASDVGTQLQQMMFYYESDIVCNSPLDINYRYLKHYESLKVAPFLKLSHSSSTKSSDESTVYILYVKVMGKQNCTFENILSLSDEHSIKPLVLDEKSMHMFGLKAVKKQCNKTNVLQKINLVDDALVEDDEIQLSKMKIVQGNNDVDSLKDIIVAVQWRVEDVEGQSYINLSSSSATTDNTTQFAPPNIPIVPPTVVEDKLITWSVSYNQQAHDFTNDGMCFREVTVHMRNLSAEDLQITVDGNIDDMKAPLFTWVGKSLHKFQLNKSTNYDVKMIACLPRPAVYNLNTFHVYVNQSQVKNQTCTSLLTLYGV